MSAVVRQADAGQLARVGRWLDDHPVPGGRSAFRNWRSAAGSLGRESVAALVTFLEIGTPPQQYAALCALRELGVEAWGEGDEPHLRYRLVLAPGAETVVVTPVQQCQLES